MRRLRLSTGLRADALRAGRLLVFASFAAALSPSAFAQSAPPSNKYIGSEQCGVCHIDLYKNFFKNPHYKSIASGKETPEKTGCEGCHGPGGDHVAARGGKATIGAFSNFSPQQALDTCLSCHSEDISR